MGCVRLGLVVLYRARAGVDHGQLQASQPSPFDPFPFHDGFKGLICSQP